jgi:hypothetical protein
MNPFLETLIAKHHKGGLLVDTNILLMRCIGTYKPDLISRFKRTAHFAVSDYDLLDSLWIRFHRIITTPSILTEVVNLLGEPRGTDGQAMFRAVADSIQVLDERYTPSQLLAAGDHFARFGLTDAAIVKLASEGVLILTDDFRLAGYLDSKGMSAVNFNHLRDM